MITLRKKIFSVFCDRLPALSVVKSEGQNNTGTTARVIRAGTIVFERVQRSLQGRAHPKLKILIVSPKRAKEYIMKKMFVIAMTAAAMISAASAVNASACQGCGNGKEYDPNANANVRVTVRLTKEQITGDAHWDQTVNVRDINKDGYLTYSDAVISAFYAYNPTSTALPLGTDCVWGQTGRYQIEVTDGSGKQVYGNSVDGDPFCELTDGMWVHVDPYITDHTVYVLDWNGLTEDDVPLCAGNTLVDLRTVKYPAGDFRPVPAPFTEIVIDGQPTGMMTDAEGKATITLYQTPGSHKMTAKFPTKDENAVLGTYYYWIEDPEWVENEKAMKLNNTASYAGAMKAKADDTVAAETTAPAAVTTAQSTTTAAQTSTAAVTTAQAVSTAAPAETTAALTAAAETSAPAVSTAAATTAPAKQTSATGTTKAGALKTGDSAPIAALVIAGLAAAGTAVVFGRKRKEQ